MDIRFRLAAKGDLDSVLKMMGDFHAIDGYPFDENVIAPLFLKMVSSHEIGRFWLISSDEKTMGYVVLAFGFSFEYLGRDAFIDELYIEEAYRNLGIGQQTLDFVFVEAKKLGVNVLHLELERHNARGQHLYLKNGFEDNNRFLLNKWL